MGKQVSFTVTEDEKHQVHAIISKAVALQVVQKDEILDRTMDLVAVHANGCRLDLKKLASFDKFNLSHDIYGIARHLDRRTGKLQNFFLPRCSA